MESVRAPRDSEGGLKPSGHEAASSREGQSVARGWPTWAVGLALFALVAVILGGAFYLNARLRPKVDIEPIATAVPSSAPTAIPSTVPSPLPSAGGIAPTATASSDAEQASISAAYLHYWDVYSAALYSLDTSHLGEAMAGEELTQARQTVDGLRAQGHAAKVDVQHHYAIIALASDTATIQDEYLNKSYLIDLATKRPLQTPTAGNKETISCQMQRLDGTWKVVRVITISESITQQQ